MKAETRQILGCKRKRVYKTYEEAMRQEPGKPKRAKGVYVYVCDFCGNFHRTSYPIDRFSEMKLIQRVFGSLTPENITKYMETRSTQL